MTAPMEVTPAHAAASPDAVLTGVSSKVIQGRSLGRIAWIRGTFAGVPTYVHTHGLGLLAGGWGPDWPDAFGWGDALFNGNAITSSGNANIGELNDPKVNAWLAEIQQTTKQSVKNALADDIDVQVMKDAVLLPAVYTKALLYRSPVLTNIYAQSYYGMYDYGVLGMKP